MQSSGARSTRTNKFKIDRRPGAAGMAYSHRWIWRVMTLRTRLAAFAMKRRALWQDAETGRFSPDENLGHQNHLQKCCERALDAYTVEDAIFWHTEVINEISVELYSIGSKPWSDLAKQRVVSELTALQCRHGAILHRLTGIVTRGEQLVWNPQSACKR